LSDSTSKPGCNIVGDSPSVSLLPTSLESILSQDFFSFCTCSMSVIKVSVLIKPQHIDVLDAQIEALRTEMSRCLMELDADEPLAKAA
jgi:hypothetical protein